MEFSVSQHGEKDFFSAIAWSMWTDSEWDEVFLAHSVVNPSKQVKEEEQGRVSWCFVGYQLLSVGALALSSCGNGQNNHLNLHTTEIFERYPFSSEYHRIMQVSKGLLVISTADIHCKQQRLAARWHYEFHWVNRIPHNEETDSASTKRNIAVLQAALRRIWLCVSMGDLKLHSSVFRNITHLDCHSSVALAFKVEKGKAHQQKLLTNLSEKRKRTNFKLKNSFFCPSS